MPSSTAVRRQLLKVELDVTDGAPVINEFGETKPLTGVALTFADGQLTAVRLETAGYGHSAFVDAPDLAHPERWPVFLREAVAEHDPVTATRELAYLRGTLAAVRSLAVNGEMPQQVRTELLALLGG